MKALFATLLLFPMLALATPDWRVFLDQEKIPELPKPLTAKWEVKGEEVHVTVENTTGVTLAYAGRGSDCPQLFEETKKNGKWSPSFWDWCGTGMEMYRFPSGSKVIFKLPAPTQNPPTRLFTIFSTADYKQRSIVMIFSGEDTARKSN
jgi:hypothetical protein